MVVAAVEGNNREFTQRRRGRLRKRHLMDFIKVQEKKNKSVVFCSRSRQNVKLDSFTLWSCNDGRECTKKGDARAKLLFCSSKPIVFLQFLLPSSSSLYKLPNRDLTI